MTKDFSGSLLPDAKPDAVVLRKGNLGGWVLEAVYGGERLTAGFSDEGAALQTLTTIMMGPVAVKAARKIAAAKAATGERKKPGPKKGWKKAKELQVEQAVAQAA